MRAQWILVFLLLCVTYSRLTGQSSWREDREMFEISASEARLPLHYLYRGITYTYAYDSVGDLICDIGQHVILRANTTSALSEVNKIYIPTDNVREISHIKARTISPFGGVTELDHRNIKEVEDERGRGGYRIFAVEGAEVGGEIEYSYIVRAKASTFVWQIVQEEAPVKRLDFTLICPENLVYEFEVANHPSGLKQTESDGEENIYHVSFADIPAYRQEPFSGGDANKMRVEGKLAYNSYSGARRLNTFSDAGRKIFESAHALSKEEVKAISSFMKEYSRPGLAPIDQLKYYEHQAKVSYLEDEYASDNVVELLFSRFGHRRAFLKLYVAILEDLGLRYEIVTTSERTVTKFNRRFDNWKYLDDFLLYLPDEKEFMAPHHVAYRYGKVPPHYTAQDGLFVGLELITDFEFPVSRLDHIPEESSTTNLSQQDYEISFEEDLSAARMSARLTYQGDRAYYYKASAIWTPMEEMEALTRELIAPMAVGAEEVVIDTEQGRLDGQTWEDPWVVVAKWQTSSLLEQAGSATLFKIGKLLGPQSRLSEDDERLFDVELINNNENHRRIAVTIPSGYVVENLEEIGLSEKVVDEKGLAFSFEATYTQKGNILEVEVKEVYDRIHFPRARFEEFRRVVNAAAAWNNVTLVFRPSG